MHTDGVVFDLYDDHKGEVLRSFFSSPAEIPDFVKKAHPLSSDERERLPDDVFALVLVDGAQKFRKFACTDAGNTELSLRYFEKAAQALPEEARRVGAQNLIKAAGWYGLEVPQGVYKLAGILGNLRGALGALAGMGQAVGGAAAAPVQAVKALTNPLAAVAANPVQAAITATTAPAFARGMKQQIKPRLEVARQAGGQIMTPEELHFQSLANSEAGRMSRPLTFESLGAGKHAEASGTPIMPNQPDSTPMGAAKTTIKKTAAHKIDDNTLELVRAFGMRQPPSLPQARALKPHVEVPGPGVPRGKEKKASRCALGEKYPLDSYAQVKKAADYFTEYGNRFSPEDRHEYCQNLTARAGELDIQVSDEIRKYGSATYAPDFEIKAAMDARRAVLGSEGLLNILGALEEHRALIPPDLFCATLSEFDKMAGLDHFYDSDVVDPFYSTFGFDKMAEDYSYQDGNDYITEMDLHRFSKTRHKQLVNSFGDDFAEEFRKDPLAIFKSLPRDQKRMVLHMASDNAPGSDTLP